MWGRDAEHAAARNTVAAVAAIVARDGELTEAFSEIIRTTSLRRPVIDAAISHWQAEPSMNGAGYDRGLKILQLARHSLVTDAAFRNGSCAGI